MPGNSPQWTPDDLNGQRVEFRFGNDPEMRIGEFIVTKKADGENRVEILFFLPDLYQTFAGINRRLELTPTQIQSIRLHPAWEAASPLTPKFLLLA